MKYVNKETFIENIEKVKASSVWDSNCEATLSALCTMFNWRKAKDDFLLSALLNFGVSIINCSPVGIVGTSLYSLLVLYKILPVMRIEPKELESYIEQLLQKKASIMSLNDSMFEKKYLMSKKNVAGQRVLDYSKMEKFYYIPVLLVFVVCMEIVFKSSYLNFLNVFVWGLGGILQTAILTKYATTLEKTRASVVELEKELSSINEVPSSNEVPSRSFDEVKKDRVIEYSYKHGQAIMNGREARKTYDYKTIKTKQGYTRKRTITGVKSFK